MTAGHDQVVVVSGHMVDQPDRPKPRFRPSAVRRVTNGMQDALREWKVGPNSLVIAGGARGADIIGAEQGLALGATVWLLVALPDDEFIAASVAIPGTDWEARYRALRRRCPTRFQAEELGPLRPDEDVFERNNDWCLAMGRAEAGDDGLHALVVWDGATADGPGGTGDFVQRARQLGADVLVIDPLHGNARHLT